MPLTLLAIASYEKGHAFLREAKKQGARVLLVTSESLRHTAQWPAEKKMALAHFVVWTEGGLDVHAGQLDRILKLVP